MPRTRRYFGWVIVIGLLWTAEVAILRNLFPVFIDSGGPSPSLYWGDPWSPDLGEYYRNKRYFDSVFFLPYAIVAAAFTATASVVAAFVSRRQCPSRFAVAAVGTLALNVLTILGSDFGTLREWWAGPILFLGDGAALGVREVLLLSEFFLPPVFVSGLLGASRRLSLAK